jgi:undecaprenyl-diphosphatase
VAPLSFFQSFDATWFAYIYGLSHQSVLLDTVGIFFATYAAYIWIAFVLFTAVWPNKNRIGRAVAVGLSLIAGFIARFGVKAAIVALYPRPRPFMTFSNVRPLIDTLSWENLQSFPSGHAIFFFTMAMVLYSFNKRVGKWAFIVAAFVGVARVYAGVHWPSDILGGAILGVITGWAVHRLYLICIQKK